jgi:ring-1,2-phenylacetyl-CoA epoxidase subunit PaaD
MVTEAQVWDALAEIPDPEIPVISLVDLGVVRDVIVENGRVHVGFTPTFLGCPALEVMRDADPRARRGAGRRGDPRRLMVDGPDLAGGA